MKKAFFVVIAAIFLTIFTTCQKKEAEPNILIAYFSHTGNTKAVAEYIQSSVGGDLAEIKTADPYTDDRDALLEQGREELANNIRPPLASKVENIEKYDIIFIGFPIWFSTTPMAILTFLETHDLSGKTIVPFSTRGGGDIGQSVERVKEASPNSVVVDGFHDINRANFSQAAELTAAWMKDFDAKKLMRK